MAGVFLSSVGASYGLPFAYVSRQTASHGAATSITITAPTTITSGNLLIAFICHADTTPAQKFASVPSGWTLGCNVSVPSASTSTASLTVYYKVATSSEPASYTWSGSTVSRSGTGVIFNYSGAAWDVSSNGRSQQQSPPFSMTPDPTSITVAKNNSVLFFVAASEDSNKSISAPSGYSTYETQIGGASQVGAMWVFYKTGVSAGSSGTPSTMINTTGQAYTLLTAIKPK